MNRTSPASDEQLAAEAIQGNQEAFTALYQQYFDPVYDLASRVLKDPAAAGDVAQNVFMKFLGGAEVQPPRVSFRAWLYTMTRNAAIDELRRRQRLVPIADPEMAESVFNRASTSPEGDPEQAALDSELAALVWQAAEALNPNDYILLDLNIRKGLEPDELADALGISRGNVYTRLSRLRDSLEEAVTALILSRRGRDDCSRLNDLLLGFASTESLSLTPRSRRAVNRHILECQTCQASRRRYLSATALFGGLTAALPAAALKSEIWGGLLARVAAGAPPPPTPQAPPPPTPATIVAEVAKNTAQIWSSLGASLQIAVVGMVVVGAIGVAVATTVVAGRFSTDSFPTVSQFRLVDPGVGLTGIAQNRELQVQLQLEDEAVADVTTVAWLIKEGFAGQPGPVDPDWVPSPPKTYLLSPGDGPKLVDLWLKDHNNSITHAARFSVLLDTTIPQDPTGASSPSHQIGLPSKNNLVTVRWEPARDPDPGSGIAGYSIDWDQFPNTVPDPILDLDETATETTSPSLDPGTWYLHLSTLDRAGNYTTTVHVGPFFIGSDAFAQAPNNGSGGQSGGSTGAASGAGPGGAGGPSLGVESAAPDVEQPASPQPLEETPPDIAPPDNVVGAVPGVPSNSAPSAQTGGSVPENSAAANGGSNGDQNGSSDNGDGAGNNGNGDNSSPGNDGGNQSQSGDGSSSNGGGTGGNSSGGNSDNDGGSQSDDDDDGDSSGPPPAPVVPPPPDQFQPALEVVVTGDALSKVGDLVSYSYTITNTSSGNTPPLILDDFSDSVSGNLTTPAINSGCGTLLSGGSCNFEHSREVQTADPDPLSNTGTATYHLQGLADTVTDSDSHSVDLFQPEVSIEKSGDALSKVGDTVDYVITVTNGSSLDSPNLTCTITDPLLGIDKAVNLAPGVADVTNASRTVLDSDPDPLVNTASMTCIVDGFPNVLGPFSDSHSVDLFQPSVEVTVTGPTTASEGDTVSYTYTITDTSSDGAPDLILVSATDDLLGDQSATATAAGCDSLDSGESCTFDDSRTVLDSDTDPLVNTVTVLFLPQGFTNQITGSDTHSIDLLAPGEDGIPSNIDCNPDIADDHIVDPAGVVPNTFLGSVHSTLQAAVNAAADDQIISMYADTQENVVIGSSQGSGGKDLLIIGCGHTITADDLNLPVVHIEGSAGADDGDTGAGEKDIHIEDLRTEKGSEGYLVQTSQSSPGTDTLLKTVRADSNGVGIKIVGSNNEIRGANSISGNSSFGVQVTGDNNVIDSGKLEENGDSAIDVTGDGNQVKDNDVGDKDKGNSGHGININGSNSVIEGNDVFASTGKGINLVGDKGSIKKNRVGDNNNRGNGGDGILVTGDGATIEENQVFNNDGIGIGVIGDTAAIIKNDVGDSNDRKNTGNGVEVTGKEATVEDNDVFNSGGTGVLVTGDKAVINKNKVGDKNDRGSGGDGINVSGGNNLIEANDVFNSLGDGIEVSGGDKGSPNVVRKNQVGDKSGKMNQGNGILVSGDGSNGASEVEIEENTVKASGRAGIKVVGTGHGLKKNESGGKGDEDNGDCDYDLADGNLDQKDNRSDGLGVDLAIPGCTGAP